MREAVEREGLSEAKTVGPAGLFRPMAEEDIFTLGTVVWRRGWFVRPGRRGEWLFSMDLPESYGVEQTHRSWTGKTVRYTWPDGGWDLELRTTLPGPLFRLHDRRLSLWFAYPNEPRTLHCLETDQEVGLLGGRADGRLYTLSTQQGPTLIVCSAEAEVSVTSHRHWRLDFDQPGAHVLVVPLLDEADIPEAPEQMELWKRLVAAPPLQCADTFSLDDRKLRLRQRFEGADLAVRSPMIQNALERTSLLEGEPGRVLCRTYLGPWAVVEGDTVETAVAIDWMDYRMAPTRRVGGGLSDWPETMAFPGDGTWDADSPMDQLMSWRIWGPLVAAMDEPLRKQLRQRLDVPSPEAFRESLIASTEPANGRSFLRDRTIFAPCGDISYDFDWYNGLTLSGLWRACDCADEQIAQPARELARRCKAQREQLAAYMEIYHDWRFWSSWTDAQGILWNVDCAQNGLEGLLGERRLRLDEGDAEGAEWIGYLAAKTAAGIFALQLLPDWLRENDLAFGDVAMRDDTYGVKGLYPHMRIGTTEPFIKNPYPLPRYLPEYSALLKLHASRQRLEQITRWWEEMPERYADWDRWFFDRSEPDGPLVRKRTISDDPPKTHKYESGGWAPALHHAFPEIALRTWVLDQPHDQVEAMYQTPLALAEQIILRGGFVLARDKS